MNLGSWGGIHLLSGLVSPHMTLSIVEAMAPVTLYVSGNGVQDVALSNEAGFEHYNPAFVSWMSSEVNGILGDSSVVGATQDYYGQYFKSIFHDYYDAYLHLDSAPTQRSALIESFDSAVQAGNALSVTGNLPTWITDHIDNHVYVVVNGDWRRKDAYTKAFLFWMRRHSDGTADAIYGILSSILQIEDCAGTWGGSATTDECGTCDVSFSNDCTQDCAGTWGGNLVEDECGTCDDDASNNCTQDCADIWGGGAIIDACGICDDDLANNCMAEVPAGTFMMGCNEAVDTECDTNEFPYHEVYLDLFYIDYYEVRAGEYKACVDAGACTYAGGTSGWGPTYNNDLDNNPINRVNHSEAQTYCHWLGKRLPTEAEWEKAARGTIGRKYPWGNSPVVSCTYAVMHIGGSHYGCGTGETMEVGSKPLGASPYGALDMIGNVAEWTADWYDSGYYSQTPVDGWVNPQGPDSGTLHVLRGGRFDYNSTFYFRASVRYGAPDYHDNGYGFRCAQ